MTSPLRTRTIRLAASFPEESPVRRGLLQVLAMSKAAASDMDVAQWVVDSYPESGDANFVVRGMPSVGNSVAGDFLEGLRSYFAARPFVREIMQALQNIEDPHASAITIDNQQKAQDLFQEDPREFFHAMYRLHQNGKVLFGDPKSYEAVEAWVLQKLNLSPADVSRRLSLMVPADVSNAATELLSRVARTLGAHRAQQKYPAVARLASGGRFATAKEVWALRSDVKMEVEVIEVTQKDPTANRLGGSLVREFSSWLSTLHG